MPAAVFGLGGGRAAPPEHDFMFYALATARRLNPKLDFHQGNFFALDLADGALAGIAAFYSLIHCARGELRRAVTELHRVLQPGGRLLMTVHAGIGEVTRDEAYDKRVAFVATLFSEGEVRNALEGAGFHIDAMTTRPSVRLRVPEPADLRGGGADITRFTRGDRFILSLLIAFDTSVNVLSCPSAPEQFPVRWRTPWNQTDPLPRPPLSRLRCESRVDFSRMSFRPAHFTDIKRSGPPNTSNGTEWTVPISSQPADEWVEFFKNVADKDAAVSMQWAVNTHVIQLRFTSNPDNLRDRIQRIDGGLARANEQYRSWLNEAHRKGEERRRGEDTESDRVRDLNERFKDL